MSVGLLRHLAKFSYTSSFKMEIGAVFRCLTFGMSKVQKVCIYSEECYYKEEMEFWPN